MDLLQAHLRECLFSNANTKESVFIKDDTLYEHPLLTIGYTTYHVKRDKDLIHPNFGNQAVLVYSPTSQDSEPWLYTHCCCVPRPGVHQDEPRTKTAQVWMQRDMSQLKGPNASQFARVSFIPHSGTPGEAFGFIDPSHVICGCHLIPVFDL